MEIFNEYCTLLISTILLALVNESLSSDFKYYYCGYTFIGLLVLNVGVNIICILFDAVTKSIFLIKVYTKRVGYYCGRFKNRLHKSFRKSKFLMRKSKTQQDYYDYGDEDEEVGFDSGGETGSGVRLSF